MNISNSQTEKLLLRALRSSLHPLSVKSLSHETGIGLKRIVCALETHIRTYGDRAEVRSVHPLELGFGGNPKKYHYYASTS